MYILVAVFLLALGLYCLFFLICSQKKFPAVVVKSSSTPTSSVPSYAVGSPVLRRATKPSVANVKKTKRHTPQNPNLGRVIHDTPYHLGSFKPLAHALSAVAVDSSGSYVACASSDSTVRTYSLCTSKQPSRPFDASYAQCVIPSDSLTALDFGNTSGFLFGATELSGRLVKLQVEGNGVTEQRPRLLVAGWSQHHSIHKNRVCWLFASKGPWIVTGSEGNDTTIRVFDYALSPLITIDTKQVTNAQLAISPRSGRFFAAAAWVAGVKVQEIVSHNGQYVKCEKAMDVPTPCGTTALAFSPDDSRLVVACKDGTLQLYNICVRYKVNEDPHLLRSVSLPVLDHNVTDESTRHHPGLDTLVFSGLEVDKKCFIIGSSKHLLMVFNPETLKVIVRIPYAHQTPIFAIASNLCAQWFAVVAAGERGVTLWQLPDTDEE